VLIALLADVHANLEALRACLADAERHGAQRFVFLGDLVGYGADPLAVARIAMARVAAGAIAILGNHDAAAIGRPHRMNPEAEAAIRWTRNAMDAETLGFLAALPLEREEEDRLYVHADASRPEAWRYVTDAEEARRSMDAVPHRLTFVGHVHVPQLYGLTATEKITRFRPVAGVPVPLLRPRRWCAVLGAVGQPRDGDPAACYGLYDTARSELAWMRVPYDVAAAAAKIRAAGLPERLAARLFRGG
jgi:diadenosine tetraphosphatase ApaH/serine/threonine PP2A family protein phosphatase